MESELKAVANTEVELTEQMQSLLAKLPHQTTVLWATECAERVLPYFEKSFGADCRPRLSIEAGRAWVRGELPMPQARTAAFAAHAAARGVCDVPAAMAAARAAGQAAAAAQLAGHAIHAAGYATKAANLASGQQAALAEKEWQVQRLQKFAAMA